MPLDPPQAYRKTEFTHRRGDRADQPLATNVLIGTLYYVVDEGVTEQSDGATWNVYSGAGSRTSNLVNYSYSATTTSPPGTNQVRFNAGFPYTTVTKLFFWNITQDGQNIKVGLLRIPTGSLIYVQDKNDATQFATFQTTGVATDHTTWTEYDVIHVDHGNSIGGGQVVLVQSTWGTSYVAPTFTPGSVIFAGASGAPTQDNANFFFDDTANQLKVIGSILAALLIGGTGVTDDLTLQATSGVGTTGSWIFFKVGNNGAVTAMEINHLGWVGIGTTGITSLVSALTVRQANPPDIGYVASFSSNLSCFVQAKTGIGVNEQAGFSFSQNSNSVEWRMAVVGNDTDSMRWQVVISGTPTTVGYFTKKFNFVINDSNVEPTTGSKCLIFGDGTVPATMGTNSAGLYANDVGGTVEMFGINEAGESTQLTGVPTFTDSSTGTVNDLATGDVQVVYLDNATDLTLTGMSAGRNGQRRMIISRGAGNVFLSHQTGSTAANQFFNNVTSGLTPLSANKGSAVYEYDSSISRWRLINHNQGAFIAIAFSAGNFTGNGSMTWTVASGDVTSFRYLIEGNKITVILIVATTTVGGTPSTQLLATIPYTIGGGSRTIGWANDNGTVTSVRIFLVGAGTQVAFQRFDGANWTASTDNTAAESTIVGQVT